MASRTVARIVFNRLPAIARRLPQAAMDVVQETLEDIDRTVKTGMAQSSSPSSPGQMPAIVTGQLIGSLKHEIARGKYRGVYYTDNPVGTYMEYGTRRGIAPRPFMTPAAERARGLFMAKMRRLESRLR